MIPLRFDAGENCNAVDHNPVGANFKLVAESVAHLRKGKMGHGGEHFEAERTDVVALVLRKNIISCSEISALVNSFSNNETHWLPTTPLLHPDRASPLNLLASRPC